MDWVFSDAPNVAAISTRSVVQHGAWIAQVFHDADDGCWQFHDEGREPPLEKDAMIVSLNNIVALDPTLVELADLPIGWRAWRGARTAPWQRVPAT